MEELIIAFHTNDTELDAIKELTQWLKEKDIKLDV